MDVAVGDVLGANNTTFTYYQISRAYAGTLNHRKTSEISRPSKANQKQIRRVQQ